MHSTCCIDSALCHVAVLTDTICLQEAHIVNGADRLT